MNGSAVYGERVVIVEVHGKNVRLNTGRISSTASSHVQADNESQTVVWGDRRFNPVSPDPEEAHEKVFRVNDIHLLRQQEAESLRDPDTVQERFGSIYQDHLVHKIHRCLKRLQHQ